MSGKKVALVSLSLMAIMSAAILWFKTCDRDLVEIPVRLSEQRFLQTKVEIHDISVPCLLELTSKYPLTLDPNFAKSFPALHQGKADWKDMNGNQISGDLFLIPSLKLGGCKMQKLQAVADPAWSSDCSGSIAWPLSKMNLLIDLPRRAFCGVSSRRQLRSLGFDLENMEKVDCRIDAKGVHFKMKTPFGDLDALLCTTCSHSVIRKALWEQERECVVSDVVLGNRRFEAVKFVPFEFTNELEAGAILGVEFLLKHVVYIDAQNECLYFGGEFPNRFVNQTETTLPVTFTASGQPVIDLTVEGESIKVLVDTGCSSELCLFPPAISCDHLRWLYYTEHLNFCGESRGGENYLLPSYQLGTVGLAHCILTIHERTNNESGIRIKTCGSAVFGGLLGLPLIQRGTVYFDFPRTQISLLSHLQDLSRVGANLADFESIPFSIEKGWLILEAKAVWGPMRLMLDTGASMSVIFEQPSTQDCLGRDELGNDCWMTPSLWIGDIDYGQQQFYALEVSDKLRQFDGILGMTFLREHPFYIDYPNRLIYFKRP